MNDNYNIMFYKVKVKYDDILNKKSFGSIESTLQNIDQAIEDYNAYINKNYSQEVLSNITDCTAQKTKEIQNNIYLFYYELLDFM